MTAAIRRTRLLDVGGSAFILAVFAGISFGVLFSNRRRVQEENLRLANGIFLTIALALLLLGGTPLLYFWRKDRNADPIYLSTASAQQLWTIMLLMVSVAVGCLSLLAAEVIELVAHVRGKWGWGIAINVLTILLICYVFQAVVQIIFIAKDASAEARRQQTGTQIPQSREIKRDDPSQVI